LIRYEHELKGFGLAAFLINSFTDDNSLGSFPSGHVCETIIVGVLGLRIHKPLGKLILLAAGAIAVATQVLRYHYFVDLLGGIPVIVLSLLFAHAMTDSMWSRQLDIARSSALLIDIKSPGFLQLNRERQLSVDFRNQGESDDESNTVDERWVL
jgi:membrane-associated phospholipid phosphatase